MSSTCVRGTGAVKLLGPALICTPSQTILSDAKPAQHEQAALF